MTHLWSLINLKESEYFLILTFSSPKICFVHNLPTFWKFTLTSFLWGHEIPGSTFYLKYNCPVLRVIMMSYSHYFHIIYCECCWITLSIRQQFRNFLKQENCTYLGKFNIRIVSFCIGKQQVTYQLARWIITHWLRIYPVVKFIWQKRQIRLLECVISIFCCFNTD